MSMPLTDSSVSVGLASVALDGSLDGSNDNGRDDAVLDHEALEHQTKAPQIAEDDLCTDFCLTVNPLDLHRAYQGAADPGNGAVVVMTGMVRNQTNERKVSHLEYQAYDAMVLRCWQNLATRCQEKYPAIRHVVIHHRLGVVAVGELSVVVAVGCPHRGEAFSACQFLIDRLKQKAPIWKKEYWLDGGQGWVNCEF
jgi:molybdopterin synthase catalytic subunit